MCQQVSEGYLVLRRCKFELVVVGRWRNDVRVGQLDKDPVHFIVYTDEATLDALEGADGSEEFRAGKCPKGAVEADGLVRAALRLTEGLGKYDVWKKKNGLVWIF